VESRVAGLLTDLDRAESDHGAVDLVDGPIDLLQIVGIRDDLVASDDVLDGASAIVSAEGPRGEGASAVRTL
jgi:hypothetical protein